jgi:[protein-PII] uridylyltransferase
MSATAQREDISDPEVVQRFAQHVGDREHLDNLYLLTVADMRGTSPVVWNAWKGRLLAQLYTATTQLLRRGLATPHDVDAHVADLRRDTLALLKQEHVSPELAARFWENLEPDYFLRHDADSLAWHARAIARTSSADLPVVATRYSPDVGGSELLFYTPDRDDLFSIITGGIDRLNLSIVDARVHTLRNGFALDTFVVLDNSGESITDPRALKHLAQTMRQQLLDPKPGRDLQLARLPRTLQQFPIQTRVQFSQVPNKPVTIMEVTAQDRPGLLYQVALALKHCGVNLVTAKVATYGERAEDIFFVNTREHAPLSATHEGCLADEITRRLGVVAAEPRAIAI